MLGVSPCAAAISDCGPASRDDLNRHNDPVSSAASAGGPVAMTTKTKGDREAALSFALCYDYLCSLATVDVTAVSLASDGASRRVSTVPSVAFTFANALRNCCMSAVC